MHADALDRLPPTLIDLLATAVVLRHTAPYIPVRGLLDLAATCTTTRSLIDDQPDAWRHLDLTCIKSAQIDSGPIDVGGVSWRAERMDESLTEDDFYAGPLRGILNRFHSRWTLQYVQTLILDGLSVPADLVREIVSEDRYRVKVLSIREAKNLNQGKLQQVLRYICRPTRPGATPKLKALYFFGPKDAAWNVVSQQQRLAGSQALGVTASPGAQVGAQWDTRCTSPLTADLFDEESKWYQPTGRALRRPQSDWPDTLQLCKGLIAFDAVLCRGPRHDITQVDSKDFLQPTIATIALGPAGCGTCHTSPETPAVFGESHASALPLLAPPPLHSSTTRAAQIPHHRDKHHNPPKLILRCEDCLRGRWCERCNRWWCEPCYQEPLPRTHLRTELQHAELREHLASSPPPAPGPHIKAIGVRRDCWGCGRICDACRTVRMRLCRVCRQEFCPEHDTGSRLHEVRGAVVCLTGGWC
ncbi:hypothetical protein EJ03DRAFT_332545 [Teratosphaeria nubilosa]|uniref:F-box domain-containing protein n=1 Tax=Teratosphaeria nubilosa TaxID=161662 RepID=A0A6G1KTL2_9PEZI|nr:hypothetical protein EJ03DRAFT_332545 [Teratosphaeria nubilosa]